jgi:cytochrome c peroxidase
MMNPIEMAHSLEGVERQCAQDPELRRMFISAYGPTEDPRQSPVTMDRITNAIASYERTLLRGNSPFDRFLYGNDKRALSAAAQRGLQWFRDPAKGNCAACHLVEERYALLADSKFHNLGVGMNSEGELTDLGRYLITKREGDQGAFRTPSLRNIAETAPYMHDGSLKTLKEVVDFYVGGGNSNPWLDPQIKPLTHLTGQERADLVTFLESLTGVPPSL